MFKNKYRDVLLADFNKIPDVYRFGKFTLRSGEESDYYFNVKKATMNSGCLFHIISAMGILLQTIGEDYDTIGGMQSGADPLVTGLLFDDASISDKSLDGFLWRKQVKEYGTREPFEGTIKPAAKIILVDDVATKGGSLLEIIHQIKQLRPEAQIVAAAVVVDRQEGAEQALSAQGIPLYSLLTKTDFHHHQ